ncbi:MAG: hypothetical protein HY220_00010 [Candidatus Sungbacteria bacterium]|uniref:Uncharacterized protein n=1 Tax=Candidatus Sungiibacteriota bacterium TaxID=2750080 RepID=A0A9D6QTF9_9BACT|nr:hypothetical protein [Candidatus Sungbacteria bacterium]
MKSKNLITIVGVLILLAAGYWWWSSSSSSGGAIPQSPYAQQIDQDLSGYKRLETLSPNPDVFQNKLFQSLQSSGGNAILVGSSTSSVFKGKANPFLP